MDFHVLAGLLSFEEDEDAQPVTLPKPAAPPAVRRAPLRVDPPPSSRDAAPTPTQRSTPGAACKATFTPSTPRVAAQRSGSPAHPALGCCGAFLHWSRMLRAFCFESPSCLSAVIHCVRPGPTCAHAPQKKDSRSSVAGEYSAERLQALRQNAKQLPARPARKAQSGGGGGFKLSGSFKAAVKPVDDRFEVNASDLVRGAPHYHVQALLPLTWTRTMGQSLWLGSTLSVTARREVKGAHVRPATQGRGAFLKSPAGRRLTPAERNADVTACDTTGQAAARCSWRQRSPHSSRILGEWRGATAASSDTGAAGGASANANASPSGAGGRGAWQ